MERNAEAGFFLQDLSARSWKAELSYHLRFRTLSLSSNALLILFESVDQSQISAQQSLDQGFAP
jgi:hypothetical protein